MNTCIHCRAPIVANTDFCGTCGKFIPASVLTANDNQRNTPDAYTAISSPISNQAIFGNEMQTTISTSGLTQIPLSMPLPSNSPSYATVHMPADAMQLSEEEDEDLDEAQKKIRRALLISSSAMIGDALMQGQPGPVPMVNGTPSLSNVPTVDGSPLLGNGPMMQNPTISQPPDFALQGSFRPETQAFPADPAQPWTWGPPASTPQSPEMPFDPGLGGFGDPRPPLPDPGGGNPGTAPGCLKIVSIIMIPVIVLTSIISIGLLAFGPTLSLVGSKLVSPGSTFQVVGKGFFPGSTVALALDGKPPATLSAGLAKSIKAKSDGTFTSAVTLNQDAPPGQYTIRATESFSPRSATITFTIIQPGETPTPVVTVTLPATVEATPDATVTPTVNPTPTAIPTVVGVPPTATPVPPPTPVPTATPVPTPTNTPPTLNQVDPTTLTLGPVPANSSQKASGQIRISTTGAGNISWTANWNKGQSPWLQLSSTSGTIAAPGTQTITASAQAGTLAPGSYSATVTFSSDGKNRDVKVTLTVAAGDCLKTRPGSLRFTATAGGANPGAQRVTLTNCGPAGTWTVSASNNTMGFKISKASGSLAANGTDSVDIAVTTGNLAPNTYTEQLVFRRGAASATVAVTFVVQAKPTPTQPPPTPTQPAPPPTLSVSPTNMSTDDCPQFSNCPVTLIASGKGGLSWTSSGKLTAKPGSGTIPEGGRVTISIDASSLPVCSGPSEGTITFKGPANEVTVKVTVGHVIC